MVRSNGQRLKNQGAQTQANETEFIGSAMRRNMSVKISNHLKKIACYEFGYMNFKNGKATRESIKYMELVKSNIDECNNFDIGVIDLGLRLGPGSFHANTVIIYKKQKKILHLEPHGESKHDILEVLKKTWPGYTVTNPTANCGVQMGAPWCRIYADLYSLTIADRPNLGNNPKQVKEEVMAITKNVDRLETFMKLIIDGKHDPSFYRRHIEKLDNFPRKHLAAVEYYTKGTKSGLSTQEMKNINKIKRVARPLMLSSSITPSPNVYKNMDLKYRQWKEFMEAEGFHESFHVSENLSPMRRYNMQVRNMLNMERLAMSRGSVPFDWNIRKSRAQRHLRAMEIKNANQATLRLRQQLNRPLLERVIMSPTKAKEVNAIRSTDELHRKLANPLKP
jgi:hypothetical protein